VIEEIALPIDPEFPGGEALPVSDGFFHPIARFPIESDEGMEVIRHEQDDGGVPCLPLVLKTEGLENPIGGFPLGKLRESAFRAIDGDEKCGVCANPGGRMMDPAPDFPDWFPVFIHFPNVRIGYGEMRCENVVGWLWAGTVAPRRPANGWRMRTAMEEVWKINPWLFHSRSILADGSERPSLPEAAMAGTVAPRRPANGWRMRTAMEEVWEINPRLFH
jgi:hypothetical protein